MKTILVTFVYPPVPSRNYDWQAIFQDYEPGDWVGSGMTRELAVEELLELSEYNGPYRVGYQP